MSDTSTKKKFDVNAPEAKALVDSLVHGTFTREGTMVAFPLCFPGASVPVPADESRITALDVTSEGIVYGGTSGRRTHLFVGMFHGVTGFVLDMGAVEGADHCAAVCCTRDRFVAFVNGPCGGRVIVRGQQDLPFDCIQEWGFVRQPFQDLGRVAPDERILDAVALPSRDAVAGTTSGCLFTVQPVGAKVEIVDRLPAAGRMAVGSRGNVFGLDGGEHLWRFDVASRKLTRQAVRLPQGAWGQTRLVWARDAQSGLLYTADGEGRLFSFSEEGGFSAPLGRTPVGAVGSIAVTHDGRLFGFCGDGIARMFCYDARVKTVADLGVAVSVIERRRYGYSFGAAAVGRDGEVIFGEDDDLGHVWLYFPRIGSRR